jgi:hypothetical protein
MSVEVASQRPKSNYFRCRTCCATGHERGCVAVGWYQPSGRFFLLPLPAKLTPSLRCHNRRLLIAAYHHRRAVLATPGSIRSLNQATEFNAEFQSLITRFAWNDIWGRLDHTTRRLLVWV